VISVIRIPDVPKILQSPVSQAPSSVVQAGGPSVQIIAAPGGPRGVTGAAGSVGPQGLVGPAGVLPDDTIIDGGFF
jgi:hypothetical protein